MQFILSFLFFFIFFFLKIYARLICCLWTILSSHICILTLISCCFCCVANMHVFCFIFYPFFLSSCSPLFVFLVFVFLLNVLHNFSFFLDIFIFFVCHAVRAVVVFSVIVVLSLFHFFFIFRLRLLRATTFFVPFCFLRHFWLYSFIFFVFCNFFRFFSRPLLLSFAAWVKSRLCLFAILFSKFIFMIIFFLWIRFFTWFFFVYYFLKFRDWILFVSRGM